MDKSEGGKLTEGYEMEGTTVETDVPVGNRDDAVTGLVAFAMPAAVTNSSANAILFMVFGTTALTEINGAEKIVRVEAFRNEREERADRICSRAHSRICLHLQKNGHDRCDLVDLIYIFSRKMTQKKIQLIPTLLEMPWVPLAFDGGGSSRGSTQLRGRVAFGCCVLQLPTDTNSLCLTPALLAELLSPDGCAYVAGDLRDYQQQQQQPL